MFKYSVLIAVFIYPSIRCQDFCPQIAENGKYRGLRIYHRMRGQDISGDTYLMYNRYGKEWEFEMIGTDSRIRIKEYSMKSYERPNIVHRFSKYIQNHSIKNWCDCEIKSNPVILTIL